MKYKHIHRYSYNGQEGIPRPLEKAIQKGEFYKVPDWLEEHRHCTFWELAKVFGCSWCRVRDAAQKWKIEFLFGDRREIKVRELYKHFYVRAPRYEYNGQKIKMGAMEAAIRKGKFYIVPEWLEEHSQCTDVELGKVFGVTKMRINQMRQKWGILSRPRQSEERLSVVNRQNFVDFAKRFVCPHERIFEVLQKFDLTEREAGKLLTETKELIRGDKYLSGLEGYFDKITPFYIQYSGNGQLRIKFTNGHSKNPDFVVKDRKRCIELHGDYFHITENVQELIDSYAKVGWECLVIWENYLRGFPEEVVQVVRDFANNIASLGKTREIGRNVYGGHLYLKGQKRINPHVIEIQ